MQLTTLISHCSELLRIIKKSPQASDILTSQYFRQKKYIGSKERRFISELTYSTMRMLKTSEFCGTKLLNNLNEILLKNKQNLKNKETNISIEEAVELISTYIICHHFNHIQGFNPQELLKKVYSGAEFNYDEIFISALTWLFDISPEITEECSKEILDSYLELKKNALAIRDNFQYTDSDISIISIFYSIPEWMIKTWMDNDFRKLTLKDSCLLAESLLSPAPINVRTNTAQISRKELVAELNDMDIDCHACFISPSAIQINKRYNLNEYDIYKKGFFEVQDEGSQLIGYACAPEPDDKILDACAGAGGKTLHLASLQNDMGEIHSWDTEYNRLKEIKFRQSKYNYKNITTLHLNSKNYSTLKANVAKGKIEKYDIVLVDAPCSGMGTVRRMPMLKWRLNAQLLKKISAKQFDILSFYSNFVCDGGYLVYATCSLMTEENEAVADRFLNNHSNFSQEPLMSGFEKYGITLEGLTANQHTLSLLPSVHGTDGFFIAKFKKNI